MIRVTAPADRDVRLAATTGAVVRIARGQTRVIQTYFASAAAEAGCSIVPDDTSAKETLVNAIPPERRASEVKRAVLALLAKGDPADFTESSGRPRKPSVQSLVDSFEVESAEIAAAFAEVLADRDAGVGEPAELDVQD